MRDPRQVCRDSGLYSYQAMKGAELMAARIAEDINRLLFSDSPRPLHERVAEYFSLADKPDDAADGRHKRDCRGKFPRGC